VIRHYAILSASLLLICGTACAKDPETPQPQIIVSAALDKSFTLHENTVKLPDGSELTFLRHVDVKIRASDPDVVTEPDLKTLSVVWMQVRLDKEEPTFTRLTKEERTLTSIFVRLYLPRQKGKAVRFEEQFVGYGKDSTASRLNALQQIDAKIRTTIGRSLVAEEKLVDTNSKLQVTFENPYQIPIAGLLHMRCAGVKERDRDVRVRLAPGEKQIRIVPLRERLGNVDPKQSVAPREVIEAIYVFPQLALNAPPER